MNIQSIEAIVLQSIPYRDYDQILTVFSQGHGMVKLIHKQARRNKQGRNQAIFPLTCAEFSYSEGRGEMGICHDIAILDHYLPLREKLSSLEAACEILRAIQKSQHPGISSPMLYQLLKSYLEKIGECDNSSSFSASFHLKILIHDGLLNPMSFEDLSLVKLTHEECSQITFLATCRSGLALSHYLISSQLKEKIHILFEKLTQ